MDIKEFLEKLNTVALDLSGELKNCRSRAEIDEFVESLTRKSHPLVVLRSQIKDIKEEDRKNAGQELNAVFESIKTRAYELRENLSDEVNLVNHFDDLSIYLASVINQEKESFGRLHIVSRTLEALEDVFVAMGFEVLEGPEVESDWFNFEALNISQDHPARGMWDTFYLEVENEDNILLRAHTSPVQIRTMLSRTPPIYMVAPGKCFRRDTPDARHLACFHQIEGLVVDKDISLAHMKATIETFIESYFSSDTKVRLRPSYFPFTEPSLEFEITCSICLGAGCRTCSNTGWIELGGCGIVNEAVLRNCNVDPLTYSGFAFGFGIERLAQMKYGIPDLRLLIEGDLRFLISI